MKTLKNHTRANLFYGLISAATFALIDVMIVGPSQYTLIAIPLGSAVFVSWELLDMFCTHSHES